MTYKKITIWTIFINFVWTFEQFLWILYGFIWNVNFKIFEPVYHAFISPLISYSNVNQITFRRPIKFSTTHRLNCGSNMATIMFWAYHASKYFQKLQKRFITFITFSCIFMYINSILISQWSKISTTIT